MGLGLLVAWGPGAGCSAPTSAVGLALERAERGARAHRADGGAVPSDPAAIAPAVADLLAAAAEHPADPASVAALGFVVREGGADRARRALALLRERHARAPAISALGPTLIAAHDRPEAADLLRAVVAAHPDRAERGRACYDLACLLRDRADAAERRAADAPDAPESAVAAVAVARAERIELLGRCIAEFADVPPARFNGLTVGEMARFDRAERADVAVGRVAPEIVGPDLDGRPMALGRYRGRVVVLVFAGEWCAPCRRAAATWRALLRPEAQEAAPCVVLEVNTDDQPGPLRRAIDRGDVAWPCWPDGGVAGPITESWGVMEFPTAFVIDRRGIVRSRGSDPAAVPAVVAGLAAARPARPEVRE